ncbi:hypothetical protein [Frankia sp. Mgl5]|uniref:hypothetical protein n=1 Tax=Frankia sp. Mgl5 TaxID=2933793 RepID=UPI00200E55D9|nr:hypothetical protein [Frankia sp. Mgl5]
MPSGPCAVAMGGMRPLSARGTTVTGRGEAAPTRRPDRHQGFGGGRREDRVGEHRQRSPWARPSGGENVTPDDRSRVDAGLAAWRAAAEATADPRWGRPSAEPEAGRAVVVWGRWAAGETSPGVPASNGAETVPRAADVVDAAWPGASGPGPAGPGAAPARSLRRLLAILCPPLVVLAGGAAVIGSTMTWATVRAFGIVEFAIHGTDPDQHGQLTMVLGILAMVAGLLLAGRRVDWGRMLAVIAGLMLILTAVVDVARFRRGGLLSGTGFDATTDLGPGLWVISFSGVVLVLVGVLVRYTPLARPAAVTED